MKTETQWRILVCDRGFVLVGEVSQNPNDYLFWNVDSCAVIRRWGTNNGLGQLVNGPLSGTVLDYEGDGVSVLKTSVLRSIPANSEGWNRWKAKLTTTSGATGSKTRDTAPKP